MRDLIEIYTWWELWLLASIPSAIVAVWLLFSYLIEVPNVVLRTISVWTLLILLMFGAGAVDAVRRSRSK